MVRVSSILSEILYIICIEIVFLSGYREDIMSVFMNHC